MLSRIERVCREKGLRMTGQRRVVARVLSDASDHPDVEQVYQRAVGLDSNISIATVYRTVRLFEEANIIERHDFGDGRARFEETSFKQHHHHLIDLKSGEDLSRKLWEIGHIEMVASPSRPPLKIQNLRPLASECLPADT